jgi:hypothetical protein
MPVTKVVNNKRTVITFSVEEIKAALGLPEVLAIYPLNGMIEVVTASE